MTKISPGTDSLLCVPECDLCSGIGYISYGAPVGDPNFGEIYPCPKRDLFANVDTEARFGLDHIEISMLNWEQLKEDDQAVTAGEIAKDTLMTGHGWVYLWGGHGKAKSLILKIATAMFLKDKKQAAYANMTAILDHLREAFDNEHPNLESVSRLNFWAEIPLLCIDEFDRINQTPYVSERKFSLMDKRYEAALREKSITLIASNKAPKDLGANDSYLIDRIEDGRFKVFHLPGESMRQVMEEE